MKVWAGIDPGLKGALAAVDQTGKIISISVMPIGPDGIHPNEVKTWLDNLAAWGDVSVALEKAQAMPGNGGVSMFNYGTGFGTLKAVLALSKVQFTLVHPKAWTKVMHQGTTVGEAKDRSWAAAMRLWPTQNWRATDRCKKPHDGQIDAALLAEWCRRTVG